MNVLLQIKVPVDLAMELNKKVEALRAAHAARMEVVEKKIKTLSGPNSRLEAERAILAERGKYLTVANLIRVLVTQGFPALAAAKDDDVLKFVCDVGVARGRPSEINVLRKGRTTRAA